MIRIKLSIKRKIHSNFIKKGHSSSDDSPFKNIFNTMLLELILNFRLKESFSALAYVQNLK